MVTWLIGVAVFVVLWGAVWKSQPKAGFGVLLGLPIAYVCSLLITPYVTGMHQIPLWLPPLPLVVIALTLFVFGVVTWLRADSLPPPRADDDDAHEHGAEHGHH